MISGTDVNNILAKKARREESARLICVTQCWEDKQKKKKKSRDREGGGERGEYKAGEVGVSLSRDLGEGGGRKRKWGIDEKCRRGGNGDFFFLRCRKQKEDDEI